MTDNLPRILPRKMHASIKLGTWEIPEIFYLLQEHGEVSSEEMFRVFNMGVGMIVIVPEEDGQGVADELAAAGETSWILGRVMEGEGVELV